jgi:hypothetical protein
MIFYGSASYILLDFVCYDNIVVWDENISEYMYTYRSAVNLAYVLFRFLPALEHRSSEFSEVSEVEINSFAPDSKPYSEHSYTCQTN